MFYLNYIYNLSIIFLSFCYMKKLVFIILLLFVFSSAWAMNPADALNKIPENFTSECYEYYYKIDKNEVRNNKTNEKYKTYKINIDKTSDLVISQFGFILPYKYYSSSENIYNYEKNLWWDNINYLTDDNYNTFYEVDSKTQDEIILNFDENLEKDNFSFTFNFKADNLRAEYYISLDNKNWDLIKKDNITDFSFKYFKIKFVNKKLIDSQIYRELIKIYELNFTKKSNTILVKSLYNDDIEIYSKFSCKQKDFNTKFISYDNFSIDTNTKIIDLNLENNPKYNVYTKKDLDNDWVEDSIDNCKTRYNPNQKDSNWDGRGDICMDDDNDWIIWFYDNCINISNWDQKDVNNNGVWDVCEFDKDEDWIYDSIDNCIVKSNPEQEDSDKDWIGDICDNCEYYNPSQIDKDLNWIGDICDNKKKQLEENDDDKDWIINYKDNCKETPNKDQLDSDKDWIWDVCDNCIDVDNKKQIDKNENWVWDMCEDSDWDWYLWYLDNCINITNKDQLDDDNNWVWNLCEDNDWDKILFALDNCPYNYNPNQEDIDNDNIWDKCDEKDNRYIESNKWFFIWLLVFITILFSWGIYYMFRKMK